MIMLDLLNTMVQAHNCDRTLNIDEFELLSHGQKGSRECLPADIFFVSGHTDLCYVRTLCKK